MSASDPLLKSDDGSRNDDAAWDLSDIYKLAICWALTLTTSTLLTTIGPLAASEIGVSDSLSAFTIGIFLIGAAISSVPSGYIFRRLGRVKGFSSGCVCQMIGSVLGFIAMYSESPFILFMGCLFVGFGQGLGQFYRFAAVEISPEEFKGSAVTYVLTGGVIAAFLGPTSATYSVDILPKKYGASFIAMGFIGILNQLAVSFVNFPPGVQGRGSEAIDLALQKPRPLRKILTSRMFVLSCTIATMAHTVMVMVMSNCALSMDDDYSLQTTSLVMQFHFFSMFAPGFVTGKLISSYGAFFVSVIGSVVFGLSSLIFALGVSEWNYFLGMILLGLGWNFAFSAGTVMLTQSYMPCEAVDVQAWNDFILFTVASVGSLASGYVFSAFGWYVLIYVATVMMGLNLILFSVVRDMNKSSNGLIIVAEDSEDGDMENTVAGPSFSTNASSADNRSVQNGFEERQRSRVMSRSSVALEESERMISNVRSISVA